MKFNFLKNMITENGPVKAECGILYQQGLPATTTVAVTGGKCDRCICIYPFHWYPTNLIDFLFNHQNIPC
jgi:hypothetical protein